MQIIELIGALLAGSAVLNLPAWLFARSRNEAPWWLPLIGAPAILTWTGLAASHVGPQSLANVVEAMALAALSVILCYAQAFLLNRRFPNTRRTSGVLLFSLVGVAVMLRLFMPLLPE